MYCIQGLSVWNYLKTYLFGKEVSNVLKKNPKQQQTKHKKEKQKKKGKGGLYTLQP